MGSKGLAEVDIVCVLVSIWKPKLIMLQVVF